MGDQTTTTTTTRDMPGIQSQEQQARDIMAQLGTGGMDQLGDLSNLASGNLQISPEDEELMRRIQQLSGDSARNQMQQNLDFATGNLEDTLLSRNVGNASIEAVEQAMLGRQSLSDLNLSTIEGQKTEAEQLRQHTLDRGGLQLNANQLILNRILGGAGGVAEMGLNERINQTTTTETAETPFNFNSLAQTGMMAASMAFPPAAAATAATAAIPGMQGPTPSGATLGG